MTDGDSILDPEQNIPISMKDMEWNERFESLLNFGDEFGHCNVPLQREYPLPSGRLVMLIIY